MTSYRKLTICILRIIGISVLLYSIIAVLYLSLGSRSNMAGMAFGAMLPVMIFGATLHFGAGFLSRIITAGLDEN
jgi:hypothetical protein